jgi:hypothetical protein
MKALYTTYNEAGTETVSVLFTVPGESVIAIISAQLEER